MNLNKFEIVIEIGKKDENRNLYFEQLKKIYNQINIFTALRNANTLYESKFHTFIDINWNTSYGVCAVRYQSRNVSNQSLGFGS